MAYLEQPFIIRVTDIALHKFTIFFDVLRIPLKKRAILSSFPDFDDQTLSIAQEASNRNIKIVYLRNSRKVKIPSDWRELEFDMLVLNKMSIRGYLYSLTSSWIFFTHGLIWSKYPRRNQTVVNLWHGIPLKKVGFEIGVKMPYSDFILASSTLTAPLVHKMFDPHFHIPKILPYGLPRNDLFLEDLHNSTLQQKTLLWMPTYRASTIGEIRKDGAITSNNLGLTDSELIALDLVASKCKVKIHLKPHPMTEVSLPLECKAISIVQLPETSLYKWLSGYDGLITDYSSVAIDFAMTGKPIYLLNCDKEEYSITRGYFAHLSDLLKLPEFESPESLATGILNPESLIVNSKLVHELHNNFLKKASISLWDELFAIESINEKISNEKRRKNLFKISRNSQFSLVKKYKIYDQITSAVSNTMVLLVVVFIFDKFAKRQNFCLVRSCKCNFRVWPVFLWRPFIIRI